jgi:hypothetical protein
VKARILPWLIGGPLLAFFAAIAMTNLRTVYRRRMYGERKSLILVAGGLAGMGAFLALPYGMLHRWFWTPLILDLAIPGAASLLLWLLLQAPGERPSKRRHAHRG